MPQDNHGMRISANNACKRVRAVLAHQTAVSGQGSYFMMFGDGVARRKLVRLFRDWLLVQTAEFRSEG